MQFNRRINQLLEDFSVAPKPGRSISTTGKSINQGTTSAILPGEGNIKITSASPGGMLPNPKELNLVKSIERRARHLQNKKQKSKNILQNKVSRFPGKR